MAGDRVEGNSVFVVEIVGAAPARVEACRARVEEGHLFFHRRGENGLLVHDPIAGFVPGVWASFGRPQSELLK